MHTDDRPGEHADRPVSADRHLAEAERYAKNAGVRDPVQLATMHAAIAAAKYLRAIETWTGRR